MKALLVKSWARVAVLIIFATLGGRLSAPAFGQEFLPVSAEELKLTTEPRAPEAAAIILQRRVDRDDQRSMETQYYRIKILKEDGRQYANVEIPFDRGYAEVINIRGRVTQPNGSTAMFNGEIYERELAKGKWVRYIAKTFTFPDVQIGTILEYTYTVNLKGFLFSSSWIVNSDLFTRSAQFSLRPLRYSVGVPLTLQRTSTLPVGVEPTEDPDGVIRMDVSNAPAFLQEQYMPPENGLKWRVDFVYLNGKIANDPEKFWKDTGTLWNEWLERFLKKPKAMESAVRQIVSPEDTPEVKVRKIYARVQGMRNTSYEVAKEEKEQKRSKEKYAENVEDIWKHGYGNSVELPWLFLGLARAAGVEAYGCWVSGRSESFFDPKLQQSGLLRNNVVLVKLNGQEIFLDPGSPFVAFGQLPWHETLTPGICLDGNGGKWVRTPLPGSSESQMRLVAKFKLTQDGSLEGKVTMTCTGLEAVYRRAAELHVDEVGRKKSLEETVKRLIPQTAEVELAKQPDWGNPATPFVAELDVKIANWSTSTGRRSMLPAGIFSAGERHLFESAERVHPIYFAYPYAQLDDVRIELPSGWSVASLPKARDRKGYDIQYRMDVTEEKQEIHITRELASDIFLLQKDHYDGLRNFFGAVRTGDEDPIVLETDGTRSSLHMEGVSRP